MDMRFNALALLILGYGIAAPAAVCSLLLGFDWTTAFAVYWFGGAAVIAALIGFGIMSAVLRGPSDLKTAGRDRSIEIAKDPPRHEV